MAADITTLVLETRSMGIAQSAQHLKDFTAAAEKAEVANTKLGNSAKSSGESQKASAAATEALMAKLQRQVDLLGANTSQTNSYTAAMKGLDKLHQQMAGMLGAEADAYKRLGADQSAAYKQKETMQMRDIEMQKIASQQYAAAQAEAIRMNNAMIASQRAAQASGNMLNEIGQRQLAYKKLSEAQAEAIRMNTAFDASLRRQQEALQRRDIEMHTQSTRAYAQAQAEAIRMNTARDASLQGDAVRRATIATRTHTEAMRDAHAMARGLSGSLGMLWMTYGNFAGMAVGVAIGASLKSIVTVGKDVEHTLEGIRVRGNETVASVDKIRESVMELGNGVYGPQAVAHAFETLILAGLKAEQAVSSINAALNLATVGGVSIEKAATTLVSVGTAIGFTAEGFGRVGDVIAKTAALSMSSVESLSEAFKSASSVNRLYGVSLEDIGTSLGVLSNLGIQGSAAGTALKNFYKELASESDKVGSTLRAMGLSQAALKDSAGNFKPMLEVVQLLDAGMKKLSEGEAKLAQGRTSNERGQRLMTQLLGEYNTKLAGGGNALEQFRKNVENSYGFAARGAVQMSLTAKSQIDSMFNTLKTSFATTFTDIQPEVIAFSARMKEVFGSKEFKEALADLARWFSKLALAVAENIPLIAKLTVGFVALKMAMMGGAVWQAAASGITLIGTAITGLLAGTISLSVALPALAVVLGTLSAAWAAYNLAKGDDPQKQAKDAQAYASGYIQGLTKEAENLDKINVKLREKKTLLQANAELERDESRQKMTMLDNKAVVEAEKNLQDVSSKFNFNRTKQLQDIAAAQTALNKVREVAANNAKLAAAAEATLFTKAKENADLAKAQADANRKGDGYSAAASLGGKPDTKGMNDSYHEALKIQEGYIALSNQMLSDYEKRQNALFKAGEQGKLATIENIGAAQFAASVRNIEALNVQYTLASKREDGKSDMQSFDNRRIEEVQKIIASQQQAEADNVAYLSNLNHNATKMEIRELEAKGEWIKAEQLRYSGDTSAMWDQVSKDVAKYGDKFPVLIEWLKQLRITQDAAMDTAKVKEAYSAFEVLRGAASNIFKGLVADNQGLGISGIFTAAMEASQKFQADLPALQEKLLALKALAEADGASDFAKKDYNKALSEMQTLANNQKTMWAEVGESISKSLSDAFGHAGKSAGKLLISVQQYGNTQEKLDSGRKSALAAIEKAELSTAQKALAASKVNADFDKKNSQARIHAYGDMAGAAQGFFKEGSKGYEMLGFAEKAFRAIELAGMVASLDMTVVTEGAKNIAKIPGVIMAYMSAMGPWGWAAAGVAIAAVLGGSGGGSAPQGAKERQEKAGTGTILGDENAKSESIAKSIEHLDKNSGLGLIHSQSMVNSLRTIEASMTGLSSLVFSGKLNTSSVLSSPVGGFMGKIIGGIFGGKTSVQDYGLEVKNTSMSDVYAEKLEANKYTDIKKSGGLFSSDKYSTVKADVDVALTQQISLILKGLGDAVKLAATDLGVNGADFESRMNGFVAEIGKVSFKDLKGDEVQKQFAAIFSAVGDKMANGTISGLEKFTKAGEGPLETLMRLANDVQQMTDVFAVLGTSMNAIGFDAIKLTEQFITAAGGLEKLTDGTQFVVENFFTQAERMAPITASVEAEMSRLGFSSTKTVEQFSALVRAQDLNTVEGQNNYVALLNVAEGFKTAADYAMDLAEGTVELTRAQEKAKSILEKQTELEITLLRVQGHEQEALNKERQIELESLRKLSPMLAVAQNMIYAQETLNEIRAKELELYNLTHTAAEQLDNKRRLELQTTATYLTTLQEQIYAQQDLNAVKAKELELYNLSHTPAEQLANKRKLELAAMSESVRAIQEQINAREDFNAAHTQQISLEETLAGLLGLTNLARIKEMSTINKANVGIQERINAFKDADAGVTQAMALVSRSIDAEKKRIQEASTAQIDALRASIDSTKVASDSAKKSVDTIKSVFDDIVSAVATLRGNVDSQVSLMQARSFIDMALVLARAGALPDADKLKDAIGAVTKEQSEMYSSTSDFVYAQMVQAGKLEELGGLVGKQKTIAEQQLESLDTNNALIEDQIKAIEKATASQIKELDKQLQQAQDSVSVMRGVDLSVKSVEAAIRDLQGSLSALASARSSAESVLPASATGAVPQAAGETSASVALGSMDAIARTAAPSVSDSEMMVRSWFANNVDAPKNPTDGNIAAWIDLIQYTGFINTKTKFAKDFAEMQGHTPQSIASFEVGINRVPEDMFARIHKDEAVIPKRFNPFIPGNTQSSGGSKDDSTNAEMLAELKALREEVGSLRATVVVGNANTRQLASQFDSATNGGNTMLVTIVEDISA